MEELYDVHLSLSPLILLHWQRSANYISIEKVYIFDPSERVSKMSQSAINITLCLPQSYISTRLGFSVDSIAAVPRRWLLRVSR